MGNYRAKECEFELVYLDNGLTNFDRVDAAKRGLCFLGCVGLVDGKIEIDVAHEDSTLCKLIVLRAAVLFANNLSREREAGDSLQWLQQLHALPDTRNEFGPAS
jgi:hypothetical protein